MPLATMLKGLLAFEPMFLAIPAGILFLSGFGMSVVLVLFIKQTLVEEKALHFRKIDKRREGSFVVTISPLFFLAEEILFPSPPPLDDDDEGYSSDDAVRSRFCYLLCVSSEFSRTKQGS
jgi:hypothetical protein